jgi:signal transduction histidine kinase
MTRTCGSGDPALFSGGGEMGELMRLHDWSTSPLGPPAAWPQSLRTAVDIILSSRYAMFVWWGHGLINLYNDAYRPFLGKKHPHSLGQSAREVWSEIWHLIGPRTDSVLERAESTFDEALLLVMDRFGYPEETYFTFSYSPIHGDDGEVAGLFGAVTDETQRVIGERRLRLLREVAATVAETRTPDEVCSAAADCIAGSARDLPFVLLYLNERDGNSLRLAAQVGITRGSPGAEEHVEPGRGDSVWPFTTAAREDRAVMLESLGARVPGLPTGAWDRPPGSAVVVPMRAHGSELVAGFLVVGLNPYLPFDEDYRGFVGLLAGQIGAGIARARAYQEERKRAEALAEIDRAKTAFFSNVSHEFRTPLTLMLGPVEHAMAHAATPAEVRAELDVAHRNAVRLLKLVNSLLDFSRIEAGRVQASYEPIDLASLTRDLASTFRSAIERAGLQFNVDLERLDEPVYLDREMWEKIVLNLLSNAFKFTLQGSITVRLRRDGGHAVVDVIDSGVGIPAEELPRIFDRFYRVDNARARTHEGSGIGLALVHELVKLHGGTIEVASTPAEGTTFRVRLPLGKAHLPEHRIRAPRALGSSAVAAQAYLGEALRWLPGEHDEGAAGALAPEEAPAADLDPRLKATSGARILLADDNADMREYVGQLLRPHYRVTAVPDGEAALRAAKELPPDLVLSDIMMPTLDGFGLLKALRSDPLTAAIPVIFLSARAGEEATIEGFDAGADDYLVKPFSARELVARVGAALALARVRRQAARELRTSDERFRAVQAASPDGFSVLEAVRAADGSIADFTCVYLNDAAVRMAKQPRERLLGGRVLKLFPAHRETGLFDIYVRVVESGTPWVGETGYRGDGIETVARLSVARVGDGVAVSAVDISERVRAEEALRQADRQKDQFLAMLAHELRNPLAPIRHASEVLHRIVPPEGDAHTVLDIVRRQVEHLTRLVDDLLDVSRITQKRIELEFENVDLATVIAQAVETVEPLLHEKRHELQILSGRGALYVNGDFARLVQCMVNLLMNAAKYTEPGGRILIHSREEAGRALVEVSDNGAGIPGALLPRIFDLFVQGERTLDRSEGGLGIGLSVVQRLIEMHGGRVSARSEGPGTGSAFTISLPLVQAHAKAGQPVAAAPVPSTRILVVDDNTDAADTLTMMLQLEGHEARAVYSGEDTLECLAGFDPAFVLVDIGLPTMDGYELARQIRTRTQARRPKLIALTGYGQSEDRDRALLAGFDDHLVKPVAFAELTGTLVRLSGH